MPASSSRREFLQAASAGAIAATTLSATAVRAANAANDKLVVGLIGCGGRGTHDANLFKNTPNVEVAYVCDVDASRRENIAKGLGIPASRIVTDMRKILDDKSVDAVIVTTPDHWHSPAAILACDAGKHVYVEKPISHNIREGRLLVEAAAAQQASRAARHAKPQHADDDRRGEAAPRRNHRRRCSSPSAGTSRSAARSAAAKTPTRPPASTTTPGSARRR